MSYKQLTQEQRYQIYALKQAEQQSKRIAEIVGVHASTISRELKRNLGKKGYRPKQAHQKAQARKHGAKKQIRLETWEYIEQKIRREWSPEQVSGRLQSHHKVKISHEWIYQYILANKAVGGSLYKHLRCQKRNRKRYGSNERRGSLPNRRSIDERLKMVEERSRIGDWESDTIIGKNHQQAIVTIVDRKSRLLLMQKVEKRTAEKVGEATIKMLSTEARKTLTSDNGKEFSSHELVAEALNIDYFFAHPFSSWERGTNENTNGLIRQYFPKHSTFTTITDQNVIAVMDKLNNRPRKCLGFMTPNEVYKSYSIALAS
jgi:transposase, IS30 family